jgi:Mrp family chromosome partitioning ATPase
MEQHARPFYNLAMRIFSELRRREAQAARQRVLLVTSARPHEGKTFVAQALAAHLAALSSEQIAVVDCNGERPMLHKVYGVENGFGVFDCLATQRFDRAEFRAPPEQNVHILPVGQEIKPGLLFKPEPIALFLEELAKRFGICILDGDVLGNCGSLAHLAGGVIMVVDSSRTRREVIQGIMTQADLPHDQYVGVVLNRRIQCIPQMMYKFL